ncbi:Poly(A) polymerase PAPalpha [Rozella allomycis CSF55]|uniref:Poly(A) polymerase n=1 Tax=Rozella allomycis (strain CSF55) TaxID=988480 RepID=A0A4P9YND8_ROZAC|nr:Poly(A) polymerase PAPalpha [Rozella allomycis CSF55]
MNPLPNTSIPQYGITSPISLNYPTAKDTEISTELEAILRKNGLFEAESESRKREIVLGKLNMLVRKFVQTAFIAQGFTEEEAIRAGGKIFTFGSYRLGVHSSGADIDTLCVVPQLVDRSHFFTIFFDMLKENSQVTELTAVPDAYVPVIKMHFDEIPIDLLFANLALSTIPEDLDLLDNSILRNIDEKCILSLNGSRVADQIVRLVPNIGTFHNALRCIKLWAKKRAIYSNAMGYLGGVAWALMVARICQLYPNAAPSTIVARFFSIYYQWKWPMPVMLKHIEDGPLPVWNPRVNPAERNHRMPVITPAYPSMCSTHNVCASTQSVITAEFLRGSQITLNIEHGKGKWEDLFAKSDFFSRYKVYLQVVASARSQENHRIWLGFVESRVRMFVLKLETVPGVVASPPYPYGFEKTYEDFTSLEAAYFNKADKEGEKFKFYTTTFYIGLDIDFKDIKDKKLHIERPASDFKRILLSWDGWKEDMEVLIKNVKRSELPIEVYEGEARPPIKKKALPKKRVLEEEVATPKDVGTPQYSEDVVKKIAIKSDLKSKLPEPTQVDQIEVGHLLPSHSENFQTTNPKKKVDIKVKLTSL